MRALKRIGYLLGLPALLVVVWHLLTVNSDSFFVVDPVTLAQTFVDTWVGERFWDDVAPSLVRLAVGLVLADAGAKRESIEATVRDVRTRLILENVSALRGRPLGRG